MDCPNCGLQMKISDMVIDTYPETNHFYCSCGLVLDVSEGSKPRICCCGGASRLSPDAAEKVRLALDSSI